MKKFWFQSKLNLTRLISRDLKTVFFALVFPIFFYVLYTRVFVFEMPAAEMTIWQTDYMISMVLFGSMFTSVSTMANTFLEDYLNQFQLFVHLTPTTKWKYFLSVVIIYIPINMMLLLSLGMMAYFVNGVTLAAGEWLALIVIVLLASIPFSMLGIITSYGRKMTIVNLIGPLVVFSLAILGGLWWPLEMMPSWIVSVGELLVSNQLLVFTKDWIHSHQFNAPALLGIILWIFGLIVVMIGLQRIFKYRESEVI